MEHLNLPETWVLHGYAVLPPSKVLLLAQAPKRAAGANLPPGAFDITTSNPRRKAPLYVLESSYFSIL